MTTKKPTKELTGPLTSFFKIYNENITNVEIDLESLDGGDESIERPSPIEDKSDKTKSGIVNGDSNGYAAPAQEKSNIAFVTQLGDYYIPSEPKIKIIEGEVESIHENYAIIVINIDDINLERRISLNRLRSIKSDFEGARIRFVIKETNESVISKIEKMDDPPLWAQPDEKVKSIFNKLASK